MRRKMFSVLFLLFLLSSFCWGEWDLEKREEQEEREEERREGKRALSCGRAKKIKEREEGEEIPVWVKIEIENMIQVNDKEARVLFDLSVVMIWDIETVPLEERETFEPQILFTNIVLDMRQPTVSPRQQLFVRDDQFYQLSSRVKATFAQLFDYEDFPFDSQEIFVALEGEPGVQYLLYENATKIPSFSKLTIQSWTPNGNHTKNSIRSKEVTFFDGITTVSEYVMQLKIKRETEAFIVTNIIPGLFAVCVSTSQVFLSLEANFPVRVSISIWSLVLLANIQSFPFSIIPRGETINYLEIFGLCNYILMITNFFELMVAQWLQVHGRRNARRALDYTARWILPSIVVLLNGILILHYISKTELGLILWSVLGFLFIVAVMIYIAHRKILDMSREGEPLKG